MKQEKQCETICNRCPFKPTCPFSDLSAMMRNFYCEHYKKYAAAKKNAIVWEPMTTMPLPYFPN